MGFLVDSSTRRQCQQYKHWKQLTTVVSTPQAYHEIKYSYVHFMQQILENVSRQNVMRSQMQPHFN